ncbi:hypothetical protein CVT25_000489 [Psilocybe cyanescens]|uniref:Uncharacterized protein n=1 Tax=Psilocybe cyanescens TaxID=93625 RepID=A0A409XWA9_PSICY|nr:hypothetical protein CVT25_000489 [Psilocybe cyanescens]
MSSTTSTMVYTAPPPTNNTLDREERTRLLRSSRKLGAVLGATPFVVEPESDTPSPHMLRVHREGRGFHSHSPSHSSSSSEVSSTTVVSRNGDSDYVFVRSTTRSAPYQVQAIFDNASPSSSRSASPFPGAVVPRATGVGGSPPTSVSRKRKQDIGAGIGSGEPSHTPLNMVFPIPGPTNSRQTRSGAADALKDNSMGAMGAAHPSQPLLLRLRSIPAMSATESENGHHINTQDQHSDGDSLLKPLSPVASSFNVNMSVDIIPPSPSSEDYGLSGHAHNSLSDREKRRKLAKLARTLGENIPPELVFRAAPPATAAGYGNSNASTSTSSAQASSSIASAQPLKKLLRRTSSLNASKSLQSGSTSTSSSNIPVDPVAPFNHYHNKPTSHSHSNSQFSATASLPPLAVAAAPLPVYQPHTHVHSHSQPERRHRQQQQQSAPSQMDTEIELEKSSGGKRRQHRPRSLTLGTASAFAAATAAMLTRGSSANAAIPASVKAAPAPARTRTPSTRHRTPSPERTPTLESTRGLSQHLDTYTRGTNSLDQPSPRPRPAALALAQQPRAQTYYAAGGAAFEPLPSPRPFIHVAAHPHPNPGSVRADGRASEDSMWSEDGKGEGVVGTGTEISLTMEWGRRKEREWSGEWNLKDMEDVAKKLRGLKGR